MCINKLEIIGKKDTLELIKDNFSLKWIHPIPKEYKNDEEWCLENWDCSSDVSNIQSKIDSNVLHIEFTSQPYPPIKALTTLASKFVELDITLSYLDYELKAYGDVDWSDGELVSDVAYGMEDTDNYVYVNNMKMSWINTQEDTQDDNNGDDEKIEE